MHVDQVIDDRSMMLMAYLDFCGKCIYNKNVMRNKSSMRHVKRVHQYIYRIWILIFIYLFIAITLNDAKDV